MRYEVQELSEPHLFRVVAHCRTFPRAKWYAMTLQLDGKRARVIQHGVPGVGSRVVYGEGACKTAEVLR